MVGGVGVVASGFPAIVPVGELAGEWGDGGERGFFLCGDPEEERVVN